MSLILDALKKAERQHRIGQVPRLGAVNTQQDLGQSRWFGIVVLVFLGFGMLVLGLYLGREDPQQMVSGPALLPDAQLARHEAPAFSAPQPQKPVPVLPQVAAVEKLKIQPPEPEPKEPSVTTPVIAEPPAHLLQVPPKSISELPPGFVDNLPEFNIDVHSYNDQPKRRYVLIDLEKYREGDYLDAGPLLSEILPDGVVLEHMGERFKMPIGNQ
ncbi:MAG: general secretion pathway protein GspB [gamma proteobacterium endosymbiont of Lamellibrachia anaximandri]|nr:general secretion pathway protein GspB [gamma proteobacterium endosymbiont of Lamellibrachia anaximandri]MBL3535044.1 general secretion pathway protein GspB [gamma proteobacterium endosymbiont of Lamellibrachia anaximandri]MBL3601137.1 general secretion pathway protein GspB [gamma proteobacterium endosymbiont of Lamellibrachia anaximandri]